MSQGRKGRELSTEGPVGLCERAGRPSLHQKTVSETLETIIPSCTAAVELSLRLGSVSSFIWPLEHLGP